MPRSACRGLLTRARSASGSASTPTRSSSGSLSHVRLFGPSSHRSLRPRPHENVEEREASALLS
eukprot:5385849-Prymnesium_polylepis.1